MVSSRNLQMKSFRVASAPGHSFGLQVGRFSSGDAASLDEALDQSRRALAATDHANPERTRLLFNFSVGLYSRFERTADLADLDAAIRTMACHKTQFGAEAMQRFMPARERVWNGAVSFVPASPSLSGDDLFRK